MALLVEHGGHRLIVAEAEGPMIGRVQDAYALMEQAIAERTSVIVVPVARLHVEFLKLRSGMAGEFLQKMANYRIKVAVIGDISARLEKSDALRDFVRESNRGRSVFFLPDLDALALKLSTLADQA